MAEPVTSEERTTRAKVLDRYLVRVSARIFHYDFELWAFPTNGRGYIRPWASRLRYRVGKMSSRRRNVESVTSGICLLSGASGEFMRRSG
jgi:hypothetical protein